MMVKVCGITRLEDVALCQSLGVDMLGFIFHPQSPRRVDPAWVGGIATSCRKVGVFTVQSREEVARIAQLARLDYIQLHGTSCPQDGQALGPERTIAVLWPERFPSAQAFAASAHTWAHACAFYLLDAGVSGGGHGRPLQTAWDIPPLPRPWILAGGIGPKTATWALGLGPAGVDLGSGVELAPGVKDPEKLRTTLNILRGTL